MLKSQLTISLCSSFLLLPSTYKTKLESPRSIHRSLEKISSVSAKLPKLPLNKQGMQFVKNYIKRSNQNLVTIKYRSKIPFTIIDSVFSLYGLPVELKYLAVIESELKPTAISCVGALGPWQFMPATAHILGLKMNSREDERRNYYKSTRAAARYLKDLYAQFGDWLLVIAAYNEGPAPLHAAMSKSGSRNFWVLQRYLPLETRQHVKKFIATQYFFEGRGSLTTLTKEETARYTKLVNKFAVSRATEEPLAKISPHKEQESEEKRFKRLMQASEESLRRSTQLLRDANKSGAYEGPETYLGHSNQFSNNVIVRRFYKQTLQLLWLC